MRPDIRAIVLELLADGREMSRAALLRAVAEHRSIDPRQRALRAEVAGELRDMEAEQLLIDGGPVVWLDLEQVRRLGRPSDR